MNAWLGSDPLFYPSISPAVIDFIRSAYGLLLTATLVAILPHARRYFLSERWGGYAESGRSTDWVQNPVVLPAIMAAWLAASIALWLNERVVLAAFINALFCRYFFIQMRWRSVLRGMGAPGFIAYWLGLAILLLEYTRRFAPEFQGLALLVLQVDFALIMLSAGMYKFSAGYRQNDGMELGMVNPEWGYWTAFWGRMPPDSWWFRLFNQLAWGTEVVAGLLMLVPPLRFLGGLLILVSFVFIATQIRLGFLCEMVIVCCLFFSHPGSAVDRWLSAWLPATAVATQAPIPMVNAIVGAALWGYLALLPLARAGFAYNIYGKKTLPPPVQRLFDAYTNLCGLIVWRVFSADITNFFVQIHEQQPDGARRLVSRWGSTLRYQQVAESIAVTSVFTTLKYYRSNRGLFLGRLLRYARTVPCDAGSTLVFQYVSVLKRAKRFHFHPVVEYTVEPRTGVVSEHALDSSVSVHAPADSSPIHEAARPGTYAPLLARRSHTRHARRSEAEPR
jgi:hypothetical protein